MSKILVFLTLFVAQDVVGILSPVLPLLCSLVTSPTGCLAVFMCDWSFDTSSCSKIDCFAYSAAGCPSACHYNAAIGRCTPCETATEEANCSPDSCQWEADVAVPCTPRSCSSIAAGNCEAVGCTFDEGACFDNPCHAYTNAGACTSLKTSECAWEIAFNTCLGSCGSLDDCDPRSCTPVPELNTCTPHCSLLTLPELCYARSNGACMWSGDSCILQTCFKQSSCTGDCALTADARCQPACEHLTASNCGLSAGCTVDGVCAPQSCANIPVNQCKAHSCVVSLLPAAAVGNTSCTVHLCHTMSVAECSADCSLKDETCFPTCRSLTSARCFADSFGICSIIDGSCRGFCEEVNSHLCAMHGCVSLFSGCFPCEVLLETQCAAAGESCTWIEEQSSCYTIPPHSFCLHHNSTDCGSISGCQWSEATNSCAPQCSRAGNRDLCTRLGHCGWDSVKGCRLPCQGACHASRCDAFNTDCESANCAFSPSQETCVQRSCALVHRSECVGSIGCIYDDESSLCIPDCNVQDESMCKTRERCIWQGGLCTVRCSAITEFVSCLSKALPACHWNESDGSCFEHICQSLTASGTCNANPSCVWSSDGNCSPSCNTSLLPCAELSHCDGSCKPVQCNSLSKSVCEVLGCVITNDTCTRRPCWEYTEDDCPSTCTFDGQACVPVCTTAASPECDLAVPDMLGFSCTADGNECVDRCASLTVADAMVDCPVQHCYGIAGGTTCFSCAGLFTESSCLGSSCFWDASRPMCAAAPDCGDTSSCASNDKCVRYPAGESGAGCAILCSALRFGACVVFSAGSCEWDSGSRVCRTLCSIRTRKEACIAFDDCSWNAGSSACEAKPCSSYGTSETCPSWCDSSTGHYPCATPCSRLQGDRSCFEQGRGLCMIQGGSCVDNTCYTVPDSWTCTTDASCSWTGGRCVPSCPSLRPVGKTCDEVYGYCKGALVDVACQPKHCSELLVSSSVECSFFQCESGHGTTCSEDPVSRTSSPSTAIPPTEPSGPATSLPETLVPPTNSPTRVPQAPVSLVPQYTVPTETRVPEVPPQPLVPESSSPQIVVLPTFPPETRVLETFPPSTSVTSTSPASTGGPPPASPIGLLTNSPTTVSPSSLPAESPPPSGVPQPLATTLLPVDTLPSETLEPKVSIPPRSRAPETLQPSASPINQPDCRLLILPVCTNTLGCRVLDGGTCAHDCSYYTNNEACRRSGECFWVQDTCRERDECFWTTRGCAAACASRATKRSCEASCPPGDQTCEAFAFCVWSPIVGCSPRASSCAARSPDDCLSFFHCELENDTQCIDRDGAAAPLGDSQAICSTFSVEPTCLAYGCDWKAQTSGGVCIGTLPTACDTYFVASHCEGSDSDCVFLDGTCFDACSLAVTSDACVQQGCVYFPKQLPRCARGNSGSCASRSTRASCTTPDRTPACVVDTVNRRCREIESHECFYANEPQTCVDHSDQCGWSEAEKNCVPCTTNDERGCLLRAACQWQLAVGTCLKRSVKQPMVFSMVLSTPRPSPGVAFSLTIHGISLNKTDRVAVIGSAHSCPSALSSYTTTIIGSSGRGYVTNSITQAQAGWFIACYYSTLTDQPLQVSDRLALPAFQVQYTKATALSLSTLQKPRTGESFMFVVSGHNMKSLDRYSFTYQGTSCSLDVQTYELFRVSTSTRAVASFALGTGNWILCYASVALTVDGTYDEHLTEYIALHDSPLAVLQLPGYLNEELLDAATQAFQNKTGVDVKTQNTASCSVDTVRGIRLQTEGVEGHHWGPIINVPRKKATIRFGTVAEHRYLANQVCTIPILPSLDDHTLGQSPVLSLTFSQFAVDASDLVRIFSSTAAAVRRQQQSLTDSCVEAVSGFEMIAEFSGTRTPAESVVVSLNQSGVAAQVLVVVCSDGQDLGGTGFTLDVALESACPNNCASADGTVGGVCVVPQGAVKGTCECSSGWVGPSCSERVVCSGRRGASVVVKSPRGDVDAIVAAPSTCGFLVNPEPNADRFGTFHIVIELQATTNITGTCATNNILVFSGTWDGNLIAKICPPDFGFEGKPVLLVVEATKAYLEVSTLLAGRVAFRYKSVSTVCPGELGPSGVPTRDTVCSGRGQCVSRPLPQDFDAFPDFTRMCSCDDEYAARAPHESCDHCAYGFRMANATCSNKTTCASLDECGGASRAVACVEKGCICREGWYGRNCSVSVPASVDATIRRSELGKNLALRYTFDGGKLANVGVGSRGQPDMSVLSCEGHANLPCLPDSRMRGNVYREARLLGDVSGREDEAMHMNKLVGSVGIYNDRVILPDIAGTDLDVSDSLTVSAWVKLTPSTSGFLVAKVDNVMHKNGLNARLAYAAAEVKGSFVTADPLVYFAVYLDGSERSVVYSSSKPDGPPDDVDSWKFVRKFRVGSALFDTSWHFVAITVGRSGGRWEGQIFIDGKTSSSNAEYVQCLPFPSTPVRRGVPPLEPYDRNMGTPKAEAGGMIVIGYNMTGSIDEFRMYNTKLEHFTVVEIGSSELFKSELSLSAEKLLAVAIAATVPLLCILLLPATRRCFLRRKLAIFGALERGRSVAPLPETEPKRASFSPVSPVETRDKGIHVDGAMDFALQNDRTDSNKQDSCSDVGFCHYSDSGGEATAGYNRLHDLSMASILRTKLVMIRDMWQMLALLLTSWDWPPIFSAVLGHATLPVSVDFMLVSDGAQDGANGLSTFEWAFYIGSITCCMAFIWLVAFVVTESKETAKGKLWKRQKWREIMRRHSVESRVVVPGESRKRGSEVEQELVAAGLRKTWQDRIAFVALFTVSTLYLPVTRGAVMILRCHRNVHCIWDCASLAEADYRYKIAFAVAVVACVAVSVSLPIFLSYVIYMKKLEFEALHPDTHRRANDWIAFTREDRTSYKDIYTGFEYRWAYFHVYLMFFKAMMCVPTLGLEKNGEAQLMAAVVIQGTFTVVVFMVAPFVVNACDRILQAGQANIMLCLGVGCLYRADPRQSYYDIILTTACAITLAYHLGTTLFNHTTKYNRTRVADISGAACSPCLAVENYAHINFYEARLGSHLPTNAIKLPTFGQQTAEMAEIRRVPGLSQCNPNDSDSSAPPCA